ncbi:hypothetical protein FACS1894124_5050 [Spirochaetia bacterium]|nr:hypothetical protein FACS1894124_5050 [Spirochaetia bacterium]
MAKRTISFTVTEAEYADILRYAVIRGHGGQHPASNFAHYAAISIMALRPLKQEQIEKWDRDTKNEV